MCGMLSQGERVELGGYGRIKRCTLYPRHEVAAWCVAGLLHGA